MNMQMDENLLITRLLLVSNQRAFDTISVSIVSCLWYGNVTAGIMRWSWSDHHPLETAGASLFKLSTWLTDGSFSRLAACSLAVLGFVPSWQNSLRSLLLICCRWFFWSYAWTGWPFYLPMFRYLHLLPGGPFPWIYFFYLSFYSISAVMNFSDFSTSRHVSVVRILS